MASIKSIYMDMLRVNHADEAEQTPDFSLGIHSEADIP